MTDTTTPASLEPTSTDTRTPKEIAKAARKLADSIERLTQFTAYQDDIESLLAAAPNREVATNRLAITAVGATIFAGKKAAPYFDQFSEANDPDGTARAALAEKLNAPEVKESLASKIGWNLFVVVALAIVAGVIYAIWNGVVDLFTGAGDTFDWVGDIFGGIGAAAGGVGSFPGWVNENPWFFPAMVMLAGFLLVVGFIAYKLFPYASTILIFLGFIFPPFGIALVIFLVLRIIVSPRRD